MDTRTFPDDVRFRHAWRPYQARVLAELDAHLEDNHFHLVAAPSSGKTIVGLEALRRVGHPAVVFAPTVAILDQWIRRFLECFWSEARAAPNRRSAAATLTTPLPAIPRRFFSRDDFRRPI